MLLLVLLLGAAFVMTIVHAMNQAPLWVAVLLLTLAMLVQVLALG